MKEHMYYIPFSANSFRNARKFRDAVENGDFSHDYGRHMAELDGSVSYVITKCTVYGDWATDGVRMEMPGLVLLEYWGQAYCLVRDADGVWHSCWVDEEFSA